MYRTTLIALAAALVAPAASAADGAKRLSIDFSGGIRPDMAGLGATITQDGTVDTAESTLASTFFSTDKVLMSDRNNLVLWDNSQNTDSIFRMLSEEPVVGGSLLGLELGSRVRYELDDLIQFPLFVQSGFYYSMAIGGGYQERVFGDAVQGAYDASNDFAFLMQLNELDPADFVGGKMVTQYDASWFEIPFSVGIKVPITKRDYTFAYGSVGASYFKGGFSVDIDIDEKYANVLGTHMDADALSMENLSPGAVQDTIKFVNKGMGLNYGVGLQAGTKYGLSFFMEYNSSGTAASVYSNGLQPKTARLMTALSSQTLAENDDDWFKKLAFPVLTTGAAFRVGVRYYLF